MYKYLFNFYMKKYRLLVLKFLFVTDIFFRFRNQSFSFQKWEYLRKCEKFNHEGL